MSIQKYPTATAADIAAVTAALTGVAEPDQPADGDCEPWSAEITAALVHAGIPARTVTVVGTIAFPGSDTGVGVFWHQATLTGSGVVADFTARQYRTQQPVPARWIAAADEYLTGLGAATGTTAAITDPDA